MSHRELPFLLGAAAGGAACWRCCLRGCGDGLAQAGKLCGGDIVIAEQGEEEGLAGVAEESGCRTWRTSERLASASAIAWAVEEGAAFLAVGAVALLLKHADGGENGVVGEGR